MVSKFEFKKNLGTQKTIALPNYEFSGDFKELDLKLNSMMILGNNIVPNGTHKATICQVCGKEGQRINIRIT